MEDRQSLADRLNTVEADRNRGASVIFINGTVGAGKTTTANNVGELLQELGASHAVIDLDWLRNAWPAPPEDRFNLELQLRNLAPVAANFRAAGARLLIIAGVLETLDARALYEEALGSRIVVCRLVVAPARLDQRLRHRHPPGADREWHLARAHELHAILAQAGVDDFLIDVDDETGPVVAQRVLAGAGIR